MNQPPGGNNPLSYPGGPQYPVAYPQQPAPAAQGHAPQASPQGYGHAPAGDSQPQPGGYGQPAPGGYGQPPPGCGAPPDANYGTQAIAPANGIPAPYRGSVQPSSNARPKVRNPIIMLLFEVIPILALLVVAGTKLLEITSKPVNNSATTAISALLVCVGGRIFFIRLELSQMVGELKAVTGNASFSWRPFLNPSYRGNWLGVLLPREVNSAKIMRNVAQPTRGGVVYRIFPLYALAADLNDIAKAP